MGELLRGRLSYSQSQKSPSPTSKTKTEAPGMCRNEVGRLQPAGGTALLGRTPLPPHPNLYGPHARLFSHCLKLHGEDKSVPWQLDHHSATAVIIHLQQIPEFSAPGFGGCVVRLFEPGGNQQETRKSKDDRNQIAKVETNKKCRCELDII